MATLNELLASVDDLVQTYINKNTEIDANVDTAIANMANALDQSKMAQAVQAASGGNMRVIYDDVGLPSFMYRIPKVNISDIGQPGSGIHPAFIVDGVEIPEIWVGAYQATIINGRAYSLPGVDPKTYTNFDASFNACSAKGSGWHLMSNAEWNAVQGICRSMGHIPRGNTNYGRAYDAVFETGTASNNGTLGSTVECTLTGSGHASWNHNNQEFGIADLVGNIWEWQSGLRLVDGEIQIIPNNDAANQADNTATSTAWRAILEDGSLVNPGTANTLKMDGTNPIQIGTSVTNSTGTSSYVNHTFETLTNATGIVIPDILKQLGIAPYTTHDGDNIWMRNAGERLPIRGGAWGDAAAAGLSALSLSNERSGSHSSIGFRPAFCEL